MSFEKLSSRIDLAYPVILAALCSAALISSAVWTQIIFAVFLCAVLAVFPFFSKGNGLISTLIFSYIIFFVAHRLPPYFEAVLFAVFIFSAGAEVLFLTRSRAFREQFIQRGLLFWGFLFLAATLVVSGIISAFSNPLYILWGIALGVVIMAVYHGGMAKGNISDKAAKSTLLMGISAALGCIFSNCSLYALTLLSVFPCVYLALRKKWSFIPYIAGAFLLCFGAVEMYRGNVSIFPPIELLLERPIFGSGTASVGQISAAPFGALLLSMGALGLLALLTHLKHLLEISLRAFSLCRLALILTCLSALFLPSAGAAYFVWITVFYVIFALSAEEELEDRRKALINNISPLESGKLPKVAFVFVEAGKGHISPTRAVCDAFKERYGDRAEIIESYFYSDSGNSDLQSIEKLFASAVRIQNKNRILSILCRVGNFLAGDSFAQYVLMGMTKSGRRSRRAAKEQLRRLDADVIFTAHWAIPFYISKMKKPHPYTVMFCPDVLSNGMFNIDCNLFLMPMKRGHDKVRSVRMYAGGNTAVVPFPIRQEAYSYIGKRDELRAFHGIGKDDFTVLLCDGGYGMANLEKTLSFLMKRSEKMTLIAMCGTNEKLYERLSRLDTPENIKLIAVPFTDKALEYVAMADLFVGKSGANSMAEPAFFGVPIIVTKCITYIERHIKNYYVRDLKGAMFIPSPKKAANKIAAFASNPSRLKKYSFNLQNFRENCGAETMADILFHNGCER